MIHASPHAMDRSDILDMMGALKLFGMRSAFDEIVTTATKRQHEPQRPQPSLRRLRKLACAAICSRPRSTRSMPDRSSTR